MSLLRQSDYPLSSFLRLNNRNTTAKAASPIVIAAAAISTSLLRWLHQIWVMAHDLNIIRSKAQVVKAMPPISAPMGARMSVNEGRIGRSAEYGTGEVIDSVTVRPMTPDDVGAVIAVARSLPEWFNDLGMEQIATEVPNQAGAVAVADGDVVGFITWCPHEGFGEIAWIAVSPDHHRSGVGARLLDFAQDDLRDAGFIEARVETLGESVEYEPYERTRAFYRAAGFHDFKRVMTDNPGMPESLTLNKQLTPRSDDGQTHTE